jgi:hypothetical protein
MKLPLLTILLFILSFSAFAQDDAIKAVVLNQIVEIAPQNRDETADFVAVEIKTGGKVLKKFSADAVVFPHVIGTFSGGNAEYIFYRADIGSGACAGGSLYVLKFNTDISTDKITSVSVAPVLTTCLGENPPYSIVYNDKAEAVLTVADHTMNLEYLNKWVENKSVTRKR